MVDHGPSSSEQGDGDGSRDNQPSPPRSPSPGQSHTQRSQSAIRERTDLLHGLLEDAIAGRSSDEHLLECLREHNATAEETSDILDELAERRRRPVSRGPESGQGDADFHPEEQGPLREKLSWAIVQAKIDALRGVTSGGRGTADFLDALRDDADGHGIPESVLAVAPYLKDITSCAESDAHIAKTFEIRRSLSREKVADRTITYLQLARLDDPLPKAIWRDILADKFVNFEKLYAAIDSGFDHDDDTRDFAGGYVLLKKDQANARKSVDSEADWIRVYDAWAAGVKLVYRHRGDELDAFKRLILKIFRARRSEPHLAIQIDHDVREEYAKSPFHLDDRTHSDIPLFTHLTNSSTSQAAASKRPGSLMARLAPAKRVAVVCENWNFGRCDDPCRGARKHGECSECGAKHRAKDTSQCLASLQARRGRRSRTGSGFGASGSN